MYIWGLWETSVDRTPGLTHLPSVSVELNNAQLAEQQQQAEHVPCMQAESAAWAASLLQFVFLCNCDRKMRCKVCVCVCLSILPVNPFAQCELGLWLNLTLRQMCTHDYTSAPFGDEKAQIIFFFNSINSKAKSPCLLLSFGCDARVHDRRLISNLVDESLFDSSQLHFSLCNTGLRWFSFDICNTAGLSCQIRVFDLFLKHASTVCPVWRKEMWICQLIFLYWSVVGEQAEDLKIKWLFARCVCAHCQWSKKWLDAGFVCKHILWINLRTFTLHRFACHESFWGVCNCWH